MIKSYYIWVICRMYTYKHIVFRINVLAVENELMWLCSISIVLFAL